MEYLAVNLSRDWRGSRLRKIMSEDNDDQEKSARSPGAFFLCPTPGRVRGCYIGWSKRKAKASLAYANLREPVKQTCTSSLIIGCKSQVLSYQEKSPSLCHHSHSSFEAKLADACAYVEGRRGLK